MLRPGSFNAGIPYTIRLEEQNHGRFLAQPYVQGLHDFMRGEPSSICQEFFLPLVKCNLEGNCQTSGLDGLATSLGSK